MSVPLGSTTEEYIFEKFPNPKTLFIIVKFAALGISTYFFVAEAEVFPSIPTFYFVTI